jgi:hypothetical protein
MNAYRLLKGKHCFILPPELPGTDIARELQMKTNNLLCSYESNRGNDREETEEKGSRTSGTSGGSDERSREVEPGSVTDNHSKLKPNMGFGIDGIS